MNTKKQLLKARNLKVSFKLKKKNFLNIVRGVDLDIYPGEIVGLVGESGSGKSVTSKALLSINENAFMSAKELWIDDINLLDLNKESKWVKIRGQKIGYIPQDPLTSLNPTRKIGKQLLDSLNQNSEWKTKSLAEKKEYLIGLLKKFGIRNAEQVFEMYPHLLSGGMKQRIVITMVVALKPLLIVADEPTTALDPTVQASVLELFEDICREMKISIILISHNISVIAKVCDYIYVMYAGKIVEKGLKEEIFTDPKHPYTLALISAIPENKEQRLYSIKGTPLDMSNLPVGDAFAPRNEYALEIDFLKEPPLFEVTKTHYAASWLLHPDSPKVELSKELAARLKNFRKVFKNESQSTRK
ncbi:ABC transporter ATP-binding protein [Mycoplasmopsis synoviae]|uniref:ABC transporter ATP-binding protein n=1 Tax=Mycoplasmopsis synoviae TaxID=2109 RepID=UPI0012A98419|nr:ABC transporter ATP-binding protein [Mycoplasmopsis synoviae]QGL45020.1 ABC transporter ATP-binding protein [Mycoplasmopsis synoviae]QXV99761.1 ABC transporter ATP-binding protein [Mycoplasmopsis synoviae]UBM43956.1 ABC transporter ATP-binding protein [Mycoplasmopsis synoviae]